LRRGGFGMSKQVWRSGTLAAMFAALSLSGTVWAQDGSDRRKPDFPPFDQVSKDFEQVISVADGSRSLYTVWIDRKRNQLLAELPRGWQNQKYFIAVTQAGGAVFAGLQ